MNCAFFRPAISKPLPRPTVKVARCDFSDGHRPIVDLMRGLGHVDIGGTECAGDRCRAV